MAGQQIDLGSLIIQIRGDSAQFKAEVDGARKGLEGVGTAGHSSAAGITHLAASLTRELIPGFDVTTREIQTLIKTATTATGVLGLIGKVGLVGGAAVLGYAIGNIIRNFSDLQKQGYGVVESFKLATGAVKSYEERIKEANEEQKKFIDLMQASRVAVLNATKSLQEAQGKGDILGAQATGDPGAIARAQLRVSLQAIDTAKAIRDAEITQLKITAEARKQVQTKADAEALQARINAYTEYNNAIKKADDEAAAKHYDVWKSETEFLLDQFKTRLKFREDFERSLGQGNVATGAGVAGGFGAASDLTRQAQDEVRKLAGLRKLGRITDQEYFEAVTQVQQRAYIQAQQLYDTWFQFPAVMRAIGQAVDSLNTGGFSPLNDEMTKATDSTTKLLATDKELAEIQNQLNVHFANVPQATGTAGVAVQKLANDYNDLAIQAAGATQQIYSAAAAMVYFHSVGG